MKQGGLEIWVYEQIKRKKESISLSYEREEAILNEEVVSEINVCIKVSYYIDTLSYIDMLIWGNGI